MAREIEHRLDALQKDAAAHLQAGRREDAVRCSVAQMKLMDTAGISDAMAYHRLGRSLLELGAQGPAIDALKRSANRAPEMIENHVLLADLLEKTGQLEIAERACRHALSLSPDSADVMATLGVVLHRTGRAGEAVAPYRTALKAHPEWEFLYNNLSAALMETGDPAGAVAVCDAWLAHCPGHIEALSLKALALNETGDREGARHLLDFDRLLRTHAVSVPPGYDSLEAFNDALEAHVMSHPTLATPPEDHPTWHHPKLQITKDLLIGDKGPVAALEELMNDAVRAYQDAVPKDPGHPFLANPPERWKLYAWGAVLHGAGNQQPHIHEGGYLSGVYYLRIPEEVSSEENDAGAGFAGGFEVGRPPDILFCKAEPDVRAVRPYEGLMLLFPAYIYHRTIPFESATRRICIAFDVVRQ